MTFGEARRIAAMSPDISDAVEKVLAASAWDARSRARVHGETAVGCAALDESGRIVGGCNIEHRYRSHDIHAEVNAISSLVVGGGSSLAALFVAAERERFTPCGSCMDWVFEVGGEATVVLTQRQPDGPVVRHTARELMPYYPR
jgi:cytidine deaminase